MNNRIPAASFFVTIILLVNCLTRTLGDGVRPVPPTLTRDGKVISMSCDFLDITCIGRTDWDYSNTPAEIAEMVQMSKAAGVTRICYRISAVGEVTYNSDTMTVFDGCWRASALVDILQQCEPAQILVEECHKAGIEAFAWITLYDSYSGAGGMVDRFFEEHREYYWQSRDGESCCRGFPCYAYPEVVDYRMQEIREVMAFGFDGLMLCLRSHSPDRIDQFDTKYGYNPPVAAEFKKRYGYDPRKREDAETGQRIAKLNREYLNNFLREVRAEIGPEKIIAVQFFGCGGIFDQGPVLDDGTIDEIVQQGGTAYEPWPHWFCHQFTDRDVRFIWSVWDGRLWEKLHSFMSVVWQNPTVDGITFHEQLFFEQDERAYGLLGDLLQTHEENPDFLAPQLDGFKPYLMSFPFVLHEDGLRHYLRVSPEDKTMHVYTWNASLHSYITYTGQDNPDMTGKGFWARRDWGDFVLKFSRETPAELPYKQDLEKGWNLVGVPTYDHLPVSPDTLKTTPPDQISDVLWGYHPDSGYTPVVADTQIPGADSVLLPWNGYWVYAHTACELAMLPPPAESSRADSSPYVSNQPGHLRDNCEVRLLTLDLLTEDGTRDRCWVGTATHEVKSQVPPPAPNDTCSLAVIDNDRPHKIITAPPSEPRTEFTLRARLPQGASHGQLAWGDLSAIEGSIWLMDEINSRTLDMRTTNDYEYAQPSDKVHHEFRIVVTASRAPLIISSAHVSTKARTVRVVYNVNRDCKITINLRNIAGRLVRKSGQGIVLSPGTHETLINASSNSGVPLPRGQYIVELVATTSSGTQARLVRTCQIDI